MPEPASIKSESHASPTRHSRRAVAVALEALEEDEDKEDDDEDEDEC